MQHTSFIQLEYVYKDAKTREAGGEVNGLLSDRGVLARLLYSITVQQKYEGTV
jgi:hypothetical protein